MSDEAAVMVREQSNELSVSEVRAQINSIQTLMKECMHEGEHYGTIPGCGNKKVLFKPGAEKISMMFRLSPSYSVSVRDMDQGHREYTVTCTLTHGPSGRVCGEGVGLCSTMERKYRYRWVGHGDDKHAEENPDIADTYNTVLKMGKKRAHVDAVLTATAASDIFTQDIEEEEMDKRTPIKEPKAKPAAAGEGVEGVLERVTTKQIGKGTKYGMLIGGDWYGTFIDTLGKKAQALEGQRVSLLWKPNEKRPEFKDALSVEAVGVPADAPAESAPVDDLPFN